MDKLRLLFETKSKSFGRHVRESLPIKPNICEEIIRLESLSSQRSWYFFAPPLAYTTTSQLSDTLYGNRRREAVDERTGAALKSRIISRLENQKKNVEITLEHLREQQSEVDKNTEWSDLRARRRRMELLAELRRWYGGRLSRIDQALDRIVLRRALRR